MKTEGRAKRAQFETVHGTIQTPVFMNVGTVGAIKGAVSTMDLKDIGTQVELSNTYHLHVRTGDKLIKEFGGLHKFMVWDRPILTDSGGFQVFSLAGLRKIKEDVYKRQTEDTATKNNTDKSEKTQESAGAAAEETDSVKNTDCLLYTSRCV